MTAPKPKRKGYGLETRTYRGSSGNSYIVHKTRNGAFNVFMEVEAKAAADDCGATNDGGPRAKRNEVWKRRAGSGGHR
jgi:hypothetical protein